jgi:hypothetical protein
MSLRAFLSALFEHGRVAVAPPHEHLPSADVREAEQVLALRAAEVAREFPGEAPPLEISVAVWGASTLYRACQLTIYRELDAGAIDELLSAPCPAGETASRHWSADLAFLFLPDVIRHAAAASEADPLVGKLRELAAQWPLSSVSVAGIQPKGVAEIASHPGLLRLYVDRILARKDWPRLADPAVREAAAATLGAYLREWPEAAKAMEST